MGTHEFRIVGDGSKKIKGCWDSVHVVEVQEKSGGRNAHYKLTSTVMLWLETNKDGSGLMTLGGSLTRQAEHVRVFIFILFFHPSFCLVQQQALTHHSLRFLK